MHDSRRTALLCALLVAAFACGALAQEAEAPPPPPDHKDLLRTREDLTALDEHLAALWTLSRRHELEGDERNLLRLEAVERLEEVRGLLGGLVGRLKNLSDHPDFADSVRTAARAHLEALEKIQLMSVQRLVARLDDLRATRPEKAPKELGDLESLIAQELDLAARVIAWILDAMSLRADLGVADEAGEADFDATLRGVADDLAGRLRVASQEKARLGRQLSAAENADAEAAVVSDIRLRLQAINQRVDGLVTGLSRLVRLLEQRGLDSSDYRRILLSATGEVTEDILDPKVLWGLIKQAWKGALAWLADTGPDRLVQFGILLLFVVLFRWLARGLWWLFHLTRRAPGSRLARDMGQRMVVPLGTLAGVFVGLWVLGANPTTLLTGLGVASVIVGLALQDTLGNLAAGFFILLYRPYDVDDIIKAGGELGLVKSMGLANTAIVTFDNRRLYVPNRKIWSEVIENRSMETRRRVATAVRVSYEDDLDKALATIREFLAGHELVLAQPEPAVFVTELGPSWIEVAVWPWARTSDWWTVTCGLPQELLSLMKENGFRVPFARQEIAVVADGDRGRAD